MLDLKFIRENPDKVKEAIVLKNEKGDVDRVLELDQERRKVIFEVENLKKDRNENSNLVAQFKKEKKDASELIQKTQKISANIKILDEKLSNLQSNIQKLVEWIPNIPHETAPKGKDARDNVEIKTWGDIPDFDFEVKDHLNLGESLDILDFASRIFLPGRQTCQLLLKTLLTP